MREMEGIRSVYCTRFINAMFSIVRLNKFFAPGMRCRSLSDFLLHLFPVFFINRKVLSIPSLATVRLKKMMLKVERSLGDIYLKISSATFFHGLIISNNLEFANSGITSTSQAPGLLNDAKRVKMEYIFWTSIESPNT